MAGVPSRNPKAAFAAVIPMFLAVCAVAGCAASGLAEIPRPGASATLEVRELDRRARAGDKAAQLELGMRYEDGSGVERDVDTARRLYLLTLNGPRFQTQSVPVNGTVVAENTAIGRSPIWPRSFADIRAYHPYRIAALLKLCGLAPAAAGSEDCAPEKVDLLRDLAHLEANFRPCRLTTNLGEAATSPRLFIINAVDAERSIATRQCMFDRAPPPDLPPDRSRLIWTTWLVLRQLDRCAPDGDCEGRRLAERAADNLRAGPEDSLLWFAIRDAAGRAPFSQDEVGSSWWMIACRIDVPEGRYQPRETERKICRFARPRADGTTR